MAHKPREQETEPQPAQVSEVSVLSLLTPPERDKLQRIADRAGLSVAALLAAAIRRALERF